MKGGIESNDFLFVKSHTKSKPERISGYGGNQGQLIEYQPSFEDEGEWTKDTVKEQIKTTISRMLSTDIKDEQRIYVVLGLNSSLAIHKRESTPPNITVLIITLKTF